MTTVTRMNTMHRQGHDRRSWVVAEAKARFSEVIDRALADGPQTITRKGQKAVVVVSAEEWQRKDQTQRQPCGVLRVLAAARFGPQA